MAQVKIYALKTTLDQYRDRISEAIHEAVMVALEYPPEKRFHRFFPLDENNFIFPEDRSKNYTVIEISMFDGRSVEAKKNLINCLFSNLHKSVGITSQDVEITIFESPRENWGIRGVPGDELKLNYQVKI